MNIFHIDGIARSEWRQHGTVVFAATVGMIMASVAPFLLGVMMHPIEQEFGWSRASIALGPTMISIAAVLFSPFMGAAVDRFGPRRIALVGLCSLTLSIALLGATTSDVRMWWALWIFVALAAVCVKPAVWVAAVLSYFTRGRGLAIAVTLCGSAAGSAIAPAVASFATHYLGWRMGFVAVAAFCGLLTIPVVFLLFTSRLDQERKGTAAAAAPPAGRKATAERRQAVLSPVYAKLFGGALLMAFGSLVFIWNLVPIAESMGHGAPFAVFLATIAGATAIVGRLVSGQLIDHFDGNRVAAFSTILPALACLILLAAPQSEAWAIVAATALGFSLGAEMDAVAYLVSRYFGIGSFGFLFATIVGFQSLVTGLGSPAINAIFDATQSYTYALVAFIIANALSAVVFLSLGRCPPLASVDEI